MRHEARTTRRATLPPPVPRNAQLTLIGQAILMIVIAAAVNIAHTRQHAVDTGQGFWPSLVIGFLPDIMLIGSVIRLRYHRRAAFAWIGVGMSAALVGWSALSTVGSGHGTSGALMSLVCLAFAVVATAQAHVPTGEALDVLIAHVEALADDAARTAATVLDGVRADAHVTVQAAAAEASEARSEASALTVQMVDLRTALASTEASVAALTEASRTSTPDASGKPSKGRPAGVRKASGSGASTPDDMQKRRTVRDAFKASVRAEDAWTNGRLACELTGCTDACKDGEHRPTSDALANARKRASEWKAEVAAEQVRAGAQ